MNQEQELWLRLLVGYGLTEAGAESICLTHQPARIAQVVAACLQNNSIRNRAGWIITALQEEWEVPSVSMEQGPQAEIDSQAMRLCLKSMKDLCPEGCPYAEFGDSIQKYCRICPQWQGHDEKEELQTTLRG